MPVLTGTSPLMTPRIYAAVTLTVRVSLSISVCSSLQFTALLPPAAEETLSSSNVQNLRERVELESIGEGLGHSVRQF